MSDKSRRKLLKTIAAGSGAIVAGKNLPDSWTRPLVDSVVLPAHAQTSPVSCTTNTYPVITAFLEDVPSDESAGNLGINITVNVCIDSSTTAVNMVATNVGNSGLEFDETLTLSVTRPDSSVSTQGYTSYFTDTPCVPAPPSISVSVGTGQVNISALFQSGGSFINGTHQVVVTHCNHPDGTRAAVRSFDIVTS
jgi:hypothetical protein